MGPEGHYHSRQSTDTCAAGKTRLPKARIAGEHTVDLMRADKVRVRPEKRTPAETDAAGWTSDRPPG